MDAIIELVTIGQHCPTAAFMLCDKEDEELLRQNHWVYKDGYAVTGTGRSPRSAHSVIMGPPSSPGLSIDHIDGCRANNTKSNLRFCSKSEQTANRRRRGRNRANKSYWRNIYVNEDGMFCYNYDQNHGGPFATALECRTIMNALASL